MAAPPSKTLEEEKVIKAAQAFVEHYDRHQWPFKSGRGGETLGLDLQESVHALRKSRGRYVLKPYELVWLLYDTKEGIRQVGRFDYDSVGLAQSICD